MCLLSTITNREHTSQFKLVKDPSSNRLNYLLINKKIPTNPYNNLLTVLDTVKKFELQGDLLKVITNKNYNVDFADLADKGKIYEFAEKSYFDERAVGNKSTRDKSSIGILKPPAIIASGFSTKHIPENPKELCDS